MPKKIAPAAIVALKEALTNLYWYKSDLRSFLTSTLGNTSLLGTLNWEDYKRNIVSSLVDYMAKRGGEYQRELLQLMSGVSLVDDFSHLERLEDGRQKAAKAGAAVGALRKLAHGHDSLVDEQKKNEERRRVAHEQLLRKTAVRKSLDALNKEYMPLLTDPDHQRRGYRLEKILRSLFEICDLDPRASFKIVGEHIDGAFSFETTDYLFEGKWQQEPVGAAALDVLAGKLSRKLDNTLGLFLSVNGFSQDGVEAHSSGRRIMLLMDGSDLMAVLEGQRSNGVALIDEAAHDPQPRAVGQLPSQHEGTRTSCPAPEFAPRTRGTELPKPHSWGYWQHIPPNDRQVSREKHCDWLSVAFALRRHIHLDRIRIDAPASDGSDLMVGDVEGRPLI